MNPYNYESPGMGRTSVYEEYGNPTTMISHHQSSYSWLWHLISVIIIIIAFVIFYYLMQSSLPSKKWIVTQFNGSVNNPANWVGEANHAWVNKSSVNSQITLNIVPPVNPTGKLFLIDNVGGSTGANIKVVGVSGAKEVSRNIFIEAGKSAFSIWVDSTNFDILKADSNISST